ncbi:tail fiber protein [Brevibacillus humidisoli]|uniref:phage tail protein n=1 Tax=Brevibacillus humidisoli TaxID=2895522 RepID=UPI001E36E219|nr:tail fiber protein [Brevibacillus humidisoli]UFJ39580.1 tail fiber protein [Brevibacillus humidisoli]
MSEPFLGEIRIFAGNFAPRGWAFCNGQIMHITQNTALFSLLGTTYGGDGKMTFALPNLQGRAPMHWGAGQGLTPRSLGDVSGSSTVTLISQEMPTHNHLPQSQSSGSQPNPEGAIWARPSGLRPASLYGETPDTQMAPNAILPAGGSMPHNNMQPYLGLIYIIALEGVFPQRP